MSKDNSKWGYNCYILTNTIAFRWVFFLISPFLLQPHQLICSSYWWIYSYIFNISDQCYMSKNNFQYCSFSISFIQSSFKTSTCTSTYKLLIPKGMCNLSFYANTNTTKFFMNKTEYKLLYELFIFSNSIEIGTFQQTYFYSINIDTYHKLNLIL